MELDSILGTEKTSFGGPLPRFVASWYPAVSSKVAEQLMFTTVAGLASRSCVFSVVKFDSDAFRTAAFNPLKKSSVITRTPDEVHHRSVRVAIVVS